uniref:Uncharacterized protein n=1 Tax=Cacopsylla melanoneura TaxID=428564 RepID=A0A8D8R199_9HEMI
MDFCNTDFYILLPSTQGNGNGSFVITFRIIIMKKLYLKFNLFVAKHVSSIKHFWFRGCLSGLSAISCGHLFSYIRFHPSSVKLVGSQMVLGPVEISCPFA